MLFRASSSFDFKDFLAFDGSGLFVGIIEISPLMLLALLLILSGFDFDLVFFVSLESTCFFLSLSLPNTFFFFASSPAFVFSVFFNEMTHRSFAAGRMGTVAKFITNLHCIPMLRSKTMKTNTKSFLQMAIFDWICNANDVASGGTHFKLQFCSLFLRPIVVLYHLMICSKYF